MGAMLQCWCLYAFYSDADINAYLSKTNLDGSVKFSYVYATLCIELQALFTLIPLPHLPDGDDLFAYVSAFLITICPLYVVVVIVVNFHILLLLLHNDRGNFNQTWHNAFLDEGDASLSNEGPRPFSSGDNNKRIEI